MKYETEKNKILNCWIVFERHKSILNEVFRSTRKKDCEAWIKQQVRQKKNVNRYGRQKLTIKEDSVLANEKRKMKVRCSHCKHLISFFAFEKVNKKLCDYCHNYVFKDKKTEFEYRLKERLKKKEG